MLYRMVKKTRGRGRGKGGSSSSGSSLLRELESKYSKTSMPSTASVEKILDELDPRSHEKNNSSTGLGVAVGLGLVLVILGLKFAKL